jgi:uncharacterized membrane protein
MGLTWVLVLTATAFTPYFMRKNICFGISIPESEYDDPKIKLLRRNYSISSLAAGLILGIGSTAFYIWLPAERAVWIQLGSVFLYIAVSNFIYFFMRSEVKAIKQASDWEMDAGTAAEVSEGSDKTIGTAWYLLYLVPIAIAVFAAVVKYPSLPGQIPIHYNIAGEVDRYAAKSIGTFAVMPLIQLLIGLLFAGIQLWHRQVQASVELPKNSGISGHNEHLLICCRISGNAFIYLYSAYHGVHNKREADDGSACCFFSCYFCGLYLSWSKGWSGRKPIENKGRWTNKQGGQRPLLAGWFFVL